MGTGFAVDSMEWRPGRIFPYHQWHLPRAPTHPWPHQCGPPTPPHPTSHPTPPHTTSMNSQMSMASSSDTPSSETPMQMPTNCGQRARVRGAFRSSWGGRRKQGSSHHWGRRARPAPPLRHVQHSKLEGWTAGQLARKQPRSIRASWQEQQREEEGSQACLHDVAIPGLLQDLRLHPDVKPKLSTQ